jgi:hypothetical protein
MVYSGLNPKLLALTKPDTFAVSDIPLPEDDLKPVEPKAKPAAKPKLAFGLTGPEKKFVPEMQLVTKKSP